MSSVGVFQTAVIGILAGWIAEKVMKRDHSLFVNMIVGLVGAFIGAFVFRKLDIRYDGLLGMFVVSTVGAIALLAVLGLFRRAR